MGELQLTFLLGYRKESLTTFQGGYVARAIIVGAGMVGLATAWHLQERGYDVKVVDRKGVAAGSSWGNAGWLAPAKTIPLAESGLWGHPTRRSCRSHDP